MSLEARETIQALCVFGLEMICNTCGQTFFGITFKELNTPTMPNTLDGLIVFSIILK